MPKGSISASKATGPLKLPQPVEGLGDTVGKAGDQIFEIQLDGADDKGEKKQGKG